VPLLRISPADLRSLILLKLLCILARINERKSAGGKVTAQSTAEDPLKMVVKKDRNM
jgi:hypothetical protein